MIYYLSQQGLTVPEMVIYACILILVLVFSLTIHEVMHGYVAYRLGDDTARLAGRLTFNPLVHLDPLGTLMMLLAGFGWAKPVPVNYSRLTRFKNKNISVRLVSVAGVTSNFFVAWISYAIFLLLTIAGIKAGIATNLITGGGQSFAGLLLSIFSQLFYFMYIFNLMLMAFNLLPLPPLDGYHFLESFLPYKWRGFLHSYERYAGIILLVLIVVGNFSGFSPLGTLIGWIETPFKWIIETPLNILTRLLV
jgi:Zn-dependent protease